MSAKDGIAEPGSLLDEINQFGALLGKPPIRLKPITTGVAKVNVKRNFLAEIEIPFHYAGEHWVVVEVYGERDSEDGKEFLADMRCFINDESVDNILPESLLQVIASEILAGDHA